MFAKTIVESDDFIDMGATARLLYYDLGVQADDDGFVQPKRIMRMTGASSDDLKVLITKGFLIPMDDRVLVVRDWLVNNEIRKDRYKETVFQDHKKTLRVTKGNQYTLGVTAGTTIGSYSIGEDRIEEKRREENNTEKTEVLEKVEQFKNNFGRMS